LVPVAADVGGQAELVTPECGMLIPLSSPEKSVPAYADALRSLIQDSAMRQQMGRAARNRITSTFTLDHMGDGMQRILAEAIDLRQSPEYQPLSLPAEELRQREARLAIEFLQARQETKRLHLELQQRYQESQTQYAELSEKYFALLQPRPASHWFYLWLRQVTLPLYTSLQKSILNRLANLLKKRVKSTWTEDETGE
jgi:hypothetical protein